MPALLIRMSRVPKCMVTAEMMVLGERRTSPVMGSTGVPNLALISEAREERSVDVRARMATEAPAAAKARAVARPTPRLAPVMRMMRPVRAVGVLRVVMKG